MERPMEKRSHIHYESKMTAVKGYIYIAGSFLNPDTIKCARSSNWIDNDPHIYSKPFTWGICRYDLRNAADPGDYVFFVLPKRSRLPQTIFAYMKISKIITHKEAY